MHQTNKAILKSVQKGFFPENEQTEEQNFKNIKNYLVDFNNFISIQNPNSTRSYLSSILKAESYLPLQKTDHGFAVL